MKLALDRIVRRLTEEPELMQALRDGSSESLTRDLTRDELKLIIQKDVRGLRDIGLHPLLVMQFAGTFQIEPMRALVGPADESLAPKTL